MKKQKVTILIMSILVVMSLVWTADGETLEVYKAKGISASSAVKGHVANEVTESDGWMCNPTEGRTEDLLWLNVDKTAEIVKIEYDIPEEEVSKDSLGIDVENETAVLNNIADKVKVVGSEDTKSSIEIKNVDTDLSEGKMTIFLNASGYSYIGLRWDPEADSIVHISNLKIYQAGSKSMPNKENNVTLKGSGSKSTVVTNDILDIGSTGNDVSSVQS